MLDYTGVDGVMIGRAALGNPWIIGRTHQYLENRSVRFAPVPVPVVKQALLTHIKELEAYYGVRLALGLSRKYVCWYCKNFRDARKFRENYVRINEMEAAVVEIHRYFDSCGETV